MHMHMHIHMLQPVSNLEAGTIIVVTCV
jgi:hypothetical protein